MSTTSAAAAAMMARGRPRCDSSPPGPLSFALPLALPEALRHPGLSACRLGSGGHVRGGCRNGVEGAAHPSARRAGCGLRHLPGVAQTGSSGARPTAVLKPWVHLVTVR